MKYKHGCDSAPQFRRRQEVYGELQGKTAWESLLAHQQGQTTCTGISALPMPLPDEVIGHERWGRQWGKSKCHPDHQEIPPHPNDREVTADTGHAHIPAILPIPTFPQGCKGGNPTAPCTFLLQPKATSLCLVRSQIQVVCSQTGLLQ